MYIHIYILSVFVQIVGSIIRNMSHCKERMSKCLQQLTSWNTKEKNDGKIYRVCQKNVYSL